jgi:hypothetical protein
VRVLMPTARLVCAGSSEVFRTSSHGARFRGN